MATHLYTQTLTLSSSSTFSSEHIQNRNNPSKEVYTTIQEIYQLDTWSMHWLKTSTDWLAWLVVPYGCTLASTIAPLLMLVTNMRCAFWWETMKFKRFSLFLIVYHRFSLFLVISYHFSSFLTLSFLIIHYQSFVNFWLFILSLFLMKNLKSRLERLNKL